MHNLVHEQDNQHTPDRWGGGTRDRPGRHQGFAHSPPRHMQQLQPEVSQLLGECQNMLNSVRLLQELSPRSARELRQEVLAAHCRREAEHGVRLLQGAVPPISS